jgi:transposase
MERLQAFRFELMPDGEQQRDMRRFAGACRFVYNKALALQKENHLAGLKFINYVAMAKLLTGWRNGSQTPWLAEAPCHPLQQALKDLEKAYQNFFAKRADFPSFKRKGSGASFRYPDPKQIRLDQTNRRIFLPKLGWLRYRKSRDVLGDVRNVTVSQSGGKCGREHCRGHRRRNRAVRDVERRELHRAAQQFQDAPETACPLSAAHEPQGQIQQQLEEGESTRPKDAHPHCQRS